MDSEALEFVAEQRSVIVSFALVEGIDRALLAGPDGLDEVG